MTEYETFLHRIQYVENLSNTIRDLLSKIVTDVFFTDMLTNSTGNIGFSTSNLGKIFDLTYYSYLSRTIYDYNLELTMSTYDNGIILSNSTYQTEFSIIGKSNFYYSSSSVNILDIANHLDLRFVPNYNDGIINYHHKNQMIDNKILEDYGYRFLPSFSNEWSEEIYMLLKLTV